ncbi:MAG: hypothetical protein FD171_75 [Actinobacteria bacterium]|nr:MAG: hypothetical protein FD171_75 [Actinomycetota bacterium]
MTGSSGRLLVVLLLGALVGMLSGCGAPTVSPSTPAVSDESTATTVRAGWADQLMYLRPNPEPAKDATAGVYLGRIFPGSTGTIRFEVDWVSTEGLWSVPVHGTTITNESTYHQSLVLDPLGGVYVNAPLGQPYVDASAPMPLSYVDFFADLNGGGKNSAAYQESYWFVTVTGGTVTSLVEAPVQR